MFQGEPVRVMLISRSGVAEGWRDHRHDGGLVMDVRDNEVVCSGLSMPHSPRWWKGKLWLLNSGTGGLGHVDLYSGQFVPACFLPGYERGLAFTGDYALVGLSKARNQSFSGLKLDETLAKKTAEARCGIAVVHLPTGEVRYHIRFSGVVEGLYDVAVIPGAIRPMLLGFKTNEIKHMIRPK